MVFNTMRIWPTPVLNYEHNPCWHGLELNEMLRKKNIMKYPDRYEEMKEKQHVEHWALM